MCLCETKCQGGGIAPLWGAANLVTSLKKYSATWGIAAILLHVLHQKRPNTAERNCRTPSATQSFTSLIEKMHYITKKNSLETKVI